MIVPSAARPKGATKHHHLLDAEERNRWLQRGPGPDLKRRCSMFQDRQRRRVATTGLSHRPDQHVDVWGNWPLTAMSDCMCAEEAAAAGGWTWVEGADA